MEGQPHPGGLLVLPGAGGLPAGGGSWVVAGREQCSGGICVLCSASLVLNAAAKTCADFKLHLQAEQQLVDCAQAFNNHGCSG